jgi:hypothetical protein
VGDDQQAKVYLFTTHSDVTKPDLLAAVRAAYAAVFPVGHPNAAGPQHATVAREFGRRRPRRPHTHLAGEFGKRHRWKAVRQELARTHKLQVRLSGILVGEGPGPRRRKGSGPKSSPSRCPCTGRTPGLMYVLMHTPRLHWGSLMYSSSQRRVGMLFVRYIQGH